jgi:hypothetical protein
VAIAFRAGLFNIGAAGQWVGGAIVATYLGFAVSLPPVVHVVVCLLGGFAGGAVIGWLVGELKARTGAHEVIVTIMLNYIMYNLLAFLLSTPTALQKPGQSNLISPNVAADAALPHAGDRRRRSTSAFSAAWRPTRPTPGRRPPPCPVTAMCPPHSHKTNPRDHAPPPPAPSQAAPTPLPSTPRSHRAPPPPRSSAHAARHHTMCT